MIRLEACLVYLTIPPDVVTGEVAVRWPILSCLCINGDYPSSAVPTTSWTVGDSEFPLLSSPMCGVIVSAKLINLLRRLGTILSS